MAYVLWWDRVLADHYLYKYEIQNKGANGQLQYFWEAFPVGTGKNENEPESSDVETKYMLSCLPTF